ncbi:hypothetical protein OG689_42210 [Kitasatospora sp. NBC_00240]|uniref:hypothetical protein n=1 Tax=Kitasatospora sp. NBC_00240 TaxID=2903567 RepID=UPI002258BA2B|nr:hypothetical protein [Kitasatospora sp. NBC_00240]MCX5215771.1 hypothetical protein [Kitasatospora sp. NBC_00240]
MTATSTAVPGTNDAKPTAAARVAGPQVPTVTRWSGELLDPSLIVDTGPDGARLAYREETQADRVNGVLVLRFTGKPGQGQPLWNASHPGRQTRAMGGLLCRVCGAPADRTEDGVLWLLPHPTTPGGRRRTLDPCWPEGAVVEHPPICAPHALSSPRLCRALDGALLLRVANAPVYGLAGLRFDTGEGGPQAPVRGQFALDSAELRWVAATHLLRTLTGCTRMSEEHLRVELARRGEER